MKNRWLWGAAVLALCAPAFAQEDCAVLVAGDAQARGVLDNSAPLRSALADPGLLAGLQCSAVGLLDGSTDGAAVACAAATAQGAEPACWINHGVAPGQAGRHGAAMQKALTRIEQSLAPSTGTPKRIVAVVWAAGDADARQLGKVVAGPVADGSSPCTAGVYCKAAFKSDLQELLAGLRSKIEQGATTSPAAGAAAMGVTPILLVARGRVAYSDAALAEAADDDTGSQGVREAEFELAADHAGLMVGALAYDQPLQPVKQGNKRQWRLTDAGYATLAARLGQAITTQALEHNIFLGPKIEKLAWEGSELVMQINHPAATSLPSGKVCSPTLDCGLRIMESAAPSQALAFSAVFDSSRVSASGKRLTRYRIKFPQAQPSQALVLAFGYGAMAGSNQRVTVGQTVENQAPGLLAQSCRKDQPLEVCALSENAHHAVQPALYAWDGSQFVRVLRHGEHAD